MFEPIHQHLLLKARLSGESRLLYPEYNMVEKNGKGMLVDIVAAVGMTPVTAAQCVYITAEGNEGITGSINLAESHIAFHVWDNARLLMLDVYSCKVFDSATVLAVIKEYCPGIQFEYIMTIDRANGILTGDNYGM